VCNSSRFRTPWVCLHFKFYIKLMQLVQCVRYRELCMFTCILVWVLKYHVLNAWRWPVMAKTCSMCWRDEYNLLWLAVKIHQFLMWRTTAGWITYTKKIVPFCNFAYWSSGLVMNFIRSQYDFPTEPLNHTCTLSDNKYTGCVVHNLIWRRFQKLEFCGLGWQSGGNCLSLGRAIDTWLAESLSNDLHLPVLTLSVRLLYGMFTMA
jgi:hypothetical protein